MTDFDTFWSIYPSDLCGGSRNKGVKSKAKESWDKHVKDPEKVIMAVQAQIRYDREALNKGEKPYRWPFAATYINQARWEVEIESHSELKQRHEAKFCAVDNCNEPTHGPRFSCCTYHLANEPDGRMRPGILVEELRNYAMTHTLNHKDAMETLGEMLGWKS
jgi:hypothetical protein